MKEHLFQSIKNGNVNNNYDDSLMFHTQQGCWSLIHPYKFRHKMNLIDQYPSPTKGALTFEEVSSVCFPSGIKLRIIPKCASKEAKMLYDFDKPKYQLHTFATNTENNSSSNTNNKNKLATNNSSPTMYYGVSITVQEITDVSSADKETIKYLRYILKRRNAAIKLKNAIRNYVIKRRSRKYNMLKRRHSLAPGSLLFDSKNIALASYEQSMNDFNF